MYDRTDVPLAPFRSSLPTASDGEATFVEVESVSVASVVAPVTWVIVALKLLVSPAEKEIA